MVDAAGIMRAIEPRRTVQGFANTRGNHAETTVAPGTDAGQRNAMI